MLSGGGGCERTHRRTRVLTPELPRKGCRSFCGRRPLNSHVYLQQLGAGEQCVRLPVSNCDPLSLTLTRLDRVYCRLKHWPTFCWVFAYTIVHSRELVVLPCGVWPLLLDGQCRYFTSFP